MKAATQGIDETATVTATYTRHGQGLRVVFQSENDDHEGFTVDELDALQVAIVYARGRMLEHEATPAFSVRRPEDNECDLEKRFRTQLEKMVPTPT